VDAGGPLATYAAIGDRFELLGYIIVAMFVGAWLVAAVTWRVGGFDRRYRAPRS
jgi:high-affinity nickel-transport protein